MSQVESERIISRARPVANGISNAAVVDIEELTPSPLPQINNNYINGKPYTSSVLEVVRRARDAFSTGKTRSVKFRKQQLKNLMRMCDENKALFEKALEKDLRKPPQETSMCEVDFLKNEIRGALNEIDEWTKPEKPLKPLINILDGVYIRNDPYGVVLVIGAWNYPVQLTLAPLVGAIAAGNCVIMKPSEIAIATANLIADLIPKYLDKDCYQVFLGGVSETTELLGQRFDYIFFTGSTAVGKIVQAAANKFLTPTTLELGGKSPVYLDDSVNMEIATRRILWGKCLNAGQTCIAPDYVLCTKAVQDQFVKTARKVLTEWYGEDLKSSSDFVRIVSDRHYDRLVSFLDDKDKIALGGRTDQNQRFIELTILTNVHPSDPIMQEEIFGPILPIITVESVFDAISFINSGEKPLALYIFSTDKKTKNLLLSNTSSGGVAINETILHICVESLPFGGVGQSGIGAYHGKATFDTFCHKKSVLEKNYFIIAEKIASARYPPYTDAKTNYLKILLRNWKNLPIKCIQYSLVFALGAACALGVEYLCKMSHSEKDSVN